MLPHLAPPQALMSGGLASVNRRPRMAEKSAGEDGGMNRRETSAFGLGKDSAPQSCKAIPGHRGHDDSADATSHMDLPDRGCRAGINSKERSSPPNHPVHFPGPMVLHDRLHGCASRAQQDLRTPQQRKPPRVTPTLTSQGMPQRSATNTPGNARRRFNPPGSQSAPPRIQPR